MAIRGKYALVTGGSRGIGFEIAKDLVARGVRVVVTGTREETLKKAAESIGARYLVWDISDISVMQENFDKAVEMLGGFDILVNNAGVLSSHGEWGMDKLRLDEAEWDRVMNVNLKGAYFMMQTAVRYMYEHKIRGNVLNIGSVAATEPSCGPYGASKLAMWGLTRGWGRDFAHTGIVINAIGPGPVATEMNHWHEGDSMSHDRIKTGRFLTCAEVSKLAMYQLDECADQYIGQTTFLDGAYDLK